jgi:hypothetical protein
MNIRHALLKEHSKKQTVLIAGYIGEDKKRFAELMDLFFGTEYRITQRAAWVVRVCAESYPALLKPWLRKMISNLTNQGLPDAVKRNTVRILQFTSLPPSLQGLAAKNCFELLLSRKEPVAVKVFSMTVLLHICRTEPDLKNELQLIVESQMPLGTKGFISRGRKVLKELDKIRDIRYTGCPSSFQE